MAFGVNLAILGALLIWIRCCQRVSIIYIRDVHSIHLGSSLIANLGNDCSAYLESMCVQRVSARNSDIKTAAGVALYFLTAALCEFSHKDCLLALYLSKC
jgi:hypothetical protein